MPLTNLAQTNANRKILDIVEHNVLMTCQNLNLTLSDVMKSSGIGMSEWEAMKRGTSDFSIDIVWRLATALDVPFGRLVQSDVGERAVAHSGASAILIDSQSSPQNVETYLFEMGAHSMREAQPHRDGVREHVTVLRGELIVGVTGALVHVQAGQTYFFEADVNHIYQCHAQPVTAIISVFYPDVVYTGNMNMFDQRRAILEVKTGELEQANHVLVLASQAQEQHNRDLIRFLAIASHDLRQPMHAMNLYLGALQGTDMSEVARSLLNKALQCVHNMDDMFMSLLDMSRLDARAVQPQIEPFPIASVLGRLALEFAPQARAKSITFDVQSSTAWVNSDEALIGQILANLSANAVHYTNTGQISVACQCDDAVLRVEVRDSGIGIAPEQQQSVFDEFRQLHDANGNDGKKGFGLGLAIVRRLCLLLDVPVKLNSTVGCGSTFSIDLPLAENQSSDVSSQETHDVEHTDIAGKVIVVIEDDRAVLDALCSLLQQWGAQVIGASSGIEATMALAGHARPPDALICDLSLCMNESGIDVVCALWEEFNCDIPTLLVTGDMDLPRVSELAGHHVPVLFKPVRASTLLETLVRCLRSNERGLHQEQAHAVTLSPSTAAPVRNVRESS